MAGETGRPTAAVDVLRSDPRAFSFIQAVRLLANAFGGRGDAAKLQFFQEQLRVRPYLSMGFPPTDLTDMEALPVDPDEPSRYRLTATFLGLYGPSSPLPTFYTEELLDEQSDDKSVCRDFLDILNHGFFLLFALASSRYHLDYLAAEEASPDILQRLFSLVGLGHPEMLQAFDDHGALIRATGLLTQFPRSAVGLRCLLADRIGVPVQVNQCVLRTAVIPEDQRCRLGQEESMLGESAWLGSRTTDVTGKISIEIGPLDADTFTRFTPGYADHESLIRLIRFYCTEPFEFDLEFILDMNQAQPGRLGEHRWSRLGCDVWLASEPLKDARALYPDRRRMGDIKRQRSMAI